jgi:hypothetical protein
MGLKREVLKEVIKSLGKDEKGLVRIVGWWVFSLFTIKIISCSMPENDNF